MTNERMSDERLRELEHYRELKILHPSSQELLAALRSERATVERLTKVAEQARGWGDFHYSDDDQAPELAAYLSDTPAPVSEGPQQPGLPPFPQEVCPQGEFGECAFARAGLGLQCRTCNHYSHPGDAPKLDEWHSRLLASEGDA